MRQSLSHREVPSPSRRRALPPISPSVPPRPPKLARAYVPPPPGSPPIPAPTPRPHDTAAKPPAPPKPPTRAPRQSVTAVKSVPRPSISPSKPPVPGPKPAPIHGPPFVPGCAAKPPPLPKRALKPPPLPKRALKPPPLPARAVQAPPVPDLARALAPAPLPKIQEAPRRPHPSTLAPVSFDAHPHAPIAETLRPTLPPTRCHNDRQTQTAITPLAPDEPRDVRLAVPSWLMSSTVAIVTAAVVGVFGIALVALSPNSDVVQARSFGRLAPTQAPSVVPVTELAAAGVEPAMREVGNKPPAERTVDDVVALASGRASQRKDALAGLATDLERNPKLAEDPDVLHRLHAATADPELARDALRILATLPGSKAADILFEVWTGTKGETETTRLAQELLYVTSVRQKASPALAVALDLRAGDVPCEQVSDIVDRAIAHGDRRSLRPLGKLTKRRGCGTHESDDCYPCLRSDHRLRQAVSAALRRPAPKPF